MSNIERAFLINTESGTESASLCESTPAVGAVSSALWSSNCENSLTDEEREAQISRSGIAMQAWYSQYQIGGDRECLDLAYACLGRMRELIAGRSAAQIARMERQRGLDLPACANEGQA